MRRSHGFTLIEVMITVAIVGILTAIALPAYNDYVTRSRITEGVSLLSGMRVRMEQYFQDNRTYAGACAAGTIATPPANTVTQYFNISCPTTTATAYTVQALGKGTMTGFTYTLDNLNAQATTAVPAGWTASATCWVIKKGGVCAQ